MERYYKLKGATVVRSLLLVFSIAALLAHAQPGPALSVAVGGICGVLNMLLSMRGNERLVDHRSVGAFVLSSFLRVTLFAIVPVGLMRAGNPLWILAAYFAGFFIPLVLYMVFVQRAYKRD